jgi:hypothetical protein
MSIESVYGEMLGRSPDEGAYGTYAGWSDDQIRGAILGSQEYANRQRPSQPQQQQQSSGGGNNIDSLYQQYLGRSPDEGAYRTYAGFNDEQIRNAILGSQEYANRQSGGKSAGLLGLISPSNTTAPAAAYTPAPSYGEYNFEMTGKPSDVELATNPDMANAWYRFSGTSPAPAMTWATAPDVVTTSPKGISFYKDYGLEKPFSTTDIQSTVDPSTIRYGYNNTPYAGVKSNVPGLASGGEYVVDPKTGKFVLDASGNPTPVPQAPYKQGGFDTLMTTYVIPAMLAAGAIGTGLGAAGLIGGGGVAGGTATGTGITGGFGGSQGLLSAAGAPSGIAATQSVAGLGGAGTGIISGLIPTSIGMEGVAGAGSLAGILGSQTAAGLGGALAGIGLSLTPEQLAAYEAGALPASAASPGIVDTLSKAASALTPAGALTTAALGSTALKAITGTPTATPTPTTAGTPSTYAPRGQVGYDPLLSLLAPRLITRNQYSLLG